MPVLVGAVGGTVREIHIKVSRTGCLVQATLERKDADSGVILWDEVTFQDHGDTLSYVTQFLTVARNEASSDLKLSDWIKEYAHKPISALAE